MNTADEQRGAVRAAFDERAPSYDDSIMHHLLAASVARFATASDGGALVDVATGTGLVARAFAQVRPDLSVTGVDLSAGMLAVARAELPSAQWIQADAAALPLPDDSVDLVTCVAAIHLFPEPAAAIAEWGRILRPGGHVVTATFASAGHTAHAHAGHEHGGHSALGNQEQPYARNHEPFATLDRLATQLAPAGLRIDRAMTWVRTDDRVLIAQARLVG